METLPPGPPPAAGRNAPTGEPRPLNLVAHGAVVLGAVLLGLGAAASRWGDIGGAVLRVLLAAGAFSQVLLVPIALLAARAFWPRARRGPIVAHAVAAAVGFAPFLVVSAAMFSAAGAALLGSWSAQSFGCRNFPVRTWAIVADPADPKGSVLEVTIQAKRPSGVRLSFVNSYAKDGRFSAFERDVGEDPFFHLTSRPSWSARS